MTIPDKLIDRSLSEPAAEPPNISNLKHAARSRTIKRRYTAAIGATATLCVGLGIALAYEGRSPVSNIQVATQSDGGPSEVVGPVDASTTSGVRSTAIESVAETTTSSEVAIPSVTSIPPPPTSALAVTPDVGSTVVEPPSQSAAPPESETVEVPSLVGLDMQDATEVATEAGLLVEIVWVDRDAVPNEVVLVDPASGTLVPIGATITLSTATTPVTVDVSTALADIGQFVQVNGAVFVGAYSTPSSLVAVMGPEATDEESWRAELESLAAGNFEIVIERCEWNRADLQRIQLEIAQGDWDEAEGRPEIAMRIEPRSCSVVVSGGNLSPEQVESLQSRYGSAVTVEIGERPGPRIG